MPTLTQLEYILAVFKFGHFGQAAKHCHVSQPSLSAQIQKVEESLGYLIFDRMKKPIIPTTKGLGFIEQAKVVLREHKKLIEISKNQENQIGGTLKVGIIPTLSPYLLPLFVSSFAKTYPNISLQIDEAKTDTIVKKIKDDEYDVGLLATPLHEQGVFERPLFVEPFYLYAGLDHPLRSEKQIQAQNLDPQSLWLLKDGHCLRNQVLNLCGARKESGSHGNIEFEGGNLETLRALIRNGSGATLIPYLFAHELDPEERKKHIRSFENPIPSREISLVFRRNQWKKDLLKALEDSIKSHLPKGLIKLNSKTNSNQEFQILDVE